MLKIFKTKPLRATVDENTELLILLKNNFIFFLLCKFHDIVREELTIDDFENNVVTLIVLFFHISELKG